MVIFTGEIRSPRRLAEETVEIHGTQGLKLMVIEYDWLWA